jgi:hypothetical protein
VDIPALAREALKYTRRSVRAPLWAFAVLLVLAVLGLQVFIGGEPAPDELRVRVRGPAGLQRLLASGDKVAIGSALRFEVVSARHAHLTVLGLDGNKGVHRYLPAGELPIVVSSGANEIKEDVLLDDTIGPERMVALFCATPIPFEKLSEAGTRALELAGGDPRKVANLPAGCAEASVVLEKVAK